MDFRLLGPVEAVARGRPINLGPKQQRFVAAVLALEVNRAVQVDRFVDLMWPASPPRTAVHAVRVYVSGLRTVLAVASDDVEIAAYGSGYLLRADPMIVDALRFRALLDTAKAARDDDALVSTLEQALALWTGPALTGVTSDQIRDRLCGGLEEARRVAFENLCEARLRRGEHRELRDRLTGALAGEPVRERLAVLLMLALYRSGERGEALAVYRQTRQRLTDELGLDPGPELRELEMAILRGDAAPDPSRGAPTRIHTSRVRVPAQLPLAIPAFAGRGAELGWLDALLSRGATVPSTVLITAIGGTGGVGKTALAVYWAHRAANRFPDGQLYVNLCGYAPTGTPLAAGEALRGFLDALGVRPERIPAGVHARAAVFRSALAGRRMLILLDNAASADQVRPLLPGTPGCFVLVTSRAQLTGLIVTEGARPLTLDVLTPQEAHELLVRRIGRARIDAAPEAVEEIINRCARLPLALAIVAARAATQPLVDLAALAAELRGADAPLDPFTGTDPATDVRAVFSWSYRTLGDPAARLFRLLGSGPTADIAVPAAASLTGEEPATVARLLAELVGAHLLTELPGPRYTSHDLLRAYARELAVECDGEDERRASLGRVIDHYLYTAHAANQLLNPNVSELDLPAPGPGSTPEAFDDYAAGMAWFAAEQGAIAAVTAAAAAVAADTHCWNLARLSATYLSLRADWHALVSSYSVALDATHRLGDDGAQAHVHRVLARAYGRLDDPQPAHAHHNAAISLYERASDPIGEGHARMDLSWLLIKEDDLTAALTQAQAALALFRSAGSDIGEAIALNGAGWCESGLGDYPSAIAHCEQALTMFQSLDEVAGAADALDSIGSTHHRLGDFDRAVAYFDRALAGYRQVGDLYCQADTLTHLGDCHQAAGRSDPAAVAWRDALAILDDLDHPEAAALRERLGSTAPAH